ncbi:hypothetical protein [Salinarchaeum laminariae]|uniref:hypothetical protein n=1 Tax=Salinarchaeum laminariae TaxID=869888 RepID=UPI0020BFB65E|nr:hypothetical protein [Salinarchaeum laminariae]
MGGLRKLSGRKGTPSVSLDKGDLELDGLVTSDGEIPDGQRMHVQRLGRRVYLVRAVEDGSVPDVDNLLRAGQL